MREWTELKWLRIGPGNRACVCGNELGFLTRTNLLTSFVTVSLSMTVIHEILRNCELINKDYAPWSYMMTSLLIIVSCHVLFSYVIRL
jgi:hypothetical protein